MIKKIDCFVHISEWQSAGEISLPPNKTFSLTIDYPLARSAKFNISTGKNGLTTIGLINKIVKCYKKVYYKEDENGTYGIWGHDIGDLSLQGIDVDLKNNKISIHVGS